jgi:hypothetical protein
VECPALRGVWLRFAGPRVAKNNLINVAITKTNRKPLAGQIENLARSHCFPGMVANLCLLLRGCNFKHVEPRVCHDVRPQLPGIHCHAARRCPGVLRGLSRALFKCVSAGHRCSSFFWYARWRPSGNVASRLPLCCFPLHVRCVRLAESLGLRFPAGGSVCAAGATKTRTRAHRAGRQGVDTQRRAGKPTQLERRVTDLAVS